MICVYMCIYIYIYTYIGSVTTDADGTVTNLTRHYSELLANLSHLRFSEETLRSPYLSDGLPVVESGIGVVAVTTKNGNTTTKHWRRFRTDLSIEETNNMVAFLNGLDEGTIVLLSAAGDAWRNIHQSAVDAVEYLGANDFHKIRANDSYALAGIKGAKRFRAFRDFKDTAFTFLRFILIFFDKYMV